MMPTLFLCILVLTLSAAEARIHNLLPSSALRLPKNQAEKLIRELNLFPKHDINIVENDPALNAPRFVENRFQFPYLSDSAATVQDLGHHVGYYKLAHTKGARMFYFFFESRNNNVNDPVVIWLTGGPGGSDSLALFHENGPFHLTKNFSLVWNDFGWDKASNLIYVDQPTGVGFSYSTSKDDIRSTSEETAVDLYDFLQAFFGEHPQYAKNEFYITGESYAGHYIPAFASHIHQKNKKNQGIHINLKGIAIGNGWTDPAIQYTAYRDYALDMKLINESQYNNLSPLVSTCEKEIQACETGSSADCDMAYRNCDSIVNEIVDSNNGINYYDIRTKCVGEICYDFSDVDQFLNDDSVKKALGVLDMEFVSLSTVVAEAMTGEFVKNFKVGIPDLLQDGIKVLIYAGEYDLLCNWIGNLRWVDSMEWSGQKEFLSAPSVEFTVGGVKAGLRKSYGPLTFLEVYNSGHMVPMDQPNASLEMLRRWMQGKPL